MSEQHTPEPWDSFCDVCESSTPHPESEPIVRIGFADYKRARACVNACAWIDTEALEKHGAFVGSQFKFLADDRDAIKKQRDELLTALIDIRSTNASKHGTQGMMIRRCIEIATDAISSVKGGA